MREEQTTKRSLFQPVSRRSLQAWSTLTPSHTHACTCAATSLHWSLLF